MIKLVPTIQSRELLQRRFDEIESAIPGIDDSHTMYEIGFDEFSQRVSSIFDMEGDPVEWAPLAPRTVNERRKLGIPGVGPEHPILQRTKSLKRGLTDLEFDSHIEPLPTVSGEEPVMVGNVTTVEETPRGISWKFGINDERFLDMQLGNDHTPARPMLPEGIQQVEVCLEIEKKLVAFIKARLKNG